jgi:drug/metabolite transporter (DMT)-like permease
MTVALAVLAAFVFAAGVVLQQRSAVAVPVAHAARPSLLVRLVRRPIWLLGVGADVVGFGLQTLALHRGSLIVVQPLLATSLLFTLALLALVDHEPIYAGEWVAIGAVLVGVSVFLAAGSPTESASATAGFQRWWLCALPACLVVGLAMAAGLRAAGPARAAWFGLAAGIGDAFMAVLAKAFADSFGHGLSGAVVRWTPYVLVAAGVVVMLLISTAYQAGYPTRTLPIIAVADPLFGCLIGIALFGERLRLDGARGPLVVLAVVGMGVGLFRLGRDRRVAAGMVGGHKGAGDGLTAAELA